MADRPRPARIKPETPRTRGTGKKRKSRLAPVAPTPEELVKSQQRAMLYPDLGEPDQRRADDAFIAYQLYAQGFTLRDIAMQIKCSLGSARLLVDEELARRRAQFSGERDAVMMRHRESLWQIIEINFEILRGAKAAIKGNNPSAAIIQAQNTLLRMEGILIPTQRDESEVAPDLLTGLLGRLTPELAGELLLRLAERRRAETAAKEKIVSMTIEHRGGAT